MTKRIIAGLLCLVLLVTAVPVSALAAQPEPQTSMDTGDVSIEGTNGFGTLLSQEITESQTETAEESEDYEAGYTVTDLVIEGTTATVTYDSLEEALLVVALYTEDGMQMVTSATATVTADATEATVEFTGDMPEYFLASAYLVDTYDLSPLCAAYDTPMYTQEMQELLASTVEDYDADRVLNLDDDNTTNFAVYAETTKVIEAVEGFNTVASIDDENATYIIENADEQITSLTEGDVFVYPYAENEILIVKVGTIEIDGTTVTITGSELEMEEAFSHVKIADDGTTVDFEVDESNPVGGITYEGTSVGHGDVLPATDDYSDTYEKYIKFDIDIPLDKTQPGMVEGELKIVGSVELNLTASMEYYKTDSRTFFSFKVDTKVITALTVDAEIKTEIPLLPLKYRNLGLAIGFDPEFQVEVNGKVTFSATTSTMFALFYNDEKGLAIFVFGDCTDKDFSVECELFFGVDLNPVLEVAEGWILSLEVEVPIGFQFDGKFTGTDIVYESTDAETHHGCERCLGVNVYFKAGVKAELKFVKGLLPTIEGGESFSWYLFSFYYSFTNQSLGLGECPYKTYRVTFQVKDSSRVPVEGAEIFTADGVSLGTTGRNGLLVTYLKEGNHEIYTIISEEMITQTVDVKDACKVTLTSGTEDSSLGGILGDIDSDTIEDGSYIIDSGTCGDTVYWTLYNSGLLKISGSGAMENYRWVSPPWSSYREQIKQVIVETGVTTIGNTAFSSCDSLTSVTIPDSVITIGNTAFNSCDSLTSVVIPDSVTTIGYDAFFFCLSLTSVTIGNSVTTIGNHAFASCRSLTSVIIPDSVTTIDESAFAGCNSLTSVIIPDSITTISSYTFSMCEGLTSVTIPDSVTIIGYCAFDACDSLSDIYFSGTAEQWAQISIRPSNTNLTNATIHYNSTGPTAIPMPESVLSTSAEKDVPIASPDAVYPGNYGTEVTDTYVLKTASFAGLVPDEQYVLLAMKSIEVEDPLASDNLLFIDQGVALEDGTLAFQYVQRETADISYVVACGASNKNLNDATITFPEMTADGELQVVDPTVVYDGVTLTEGRDYVIVGTVDFTAGGTYTCYIRGIHNYTGLVECSYTVTAPVTEVATGWSGSTTWILTSDGVLTFSGNGNEVCNMKNYGFGGNQPWISYADQITSVVVQNGVTAVGTGAFMNLTKLESVTLPDSGLKTLGQAAFYGCSSLKEIYIPDGVYTIWAYTFKGCTSLTELRLPKTLCKLDQGAFENCTALVDVVLPGNVDIISYWAFKGCTGLTGVDMLWTNATEIRAGAFKNCTALTDVILPADIQVLGDSAFYAIGASTFTVPATVTTIEGWCFARSALKEIVFEGDAPTFGDGVFNKIALTAYYPSGNATWTSDIMQNYGGTVTWTAQ